MFILLVVLTNKLMNMKTILDTYDLAQSIEEFCMDEKSIVFFVEPLTQREVKERIEYDDNFKMLTCEINCDTSFSVTPDESKFLNDELYKDGWIMCSYGDYVVVICVKNKGNNLEISAMEVSEAYKGMGFGKVVVEAIERYAFDNGMDGVTLKSFDSSAHSFWEHMGYEDTEDGSMVKYCGL